MGLTRITSDGITDATIATADLADQSVTLAKLPHGTSSNDGKFLRANNGADPTFETVNTDLSADSSPQLGGDLDLNGNKISVGDGGRDANQEHIRFGNDGDLRIYHDGSNSYIEDSGAGNLRINSESAVHIRKHNDESIATFTANGAVELYHDNSLKFETTSSGTRTTGAMHINDGSASGNRISVGNGGDLKIFHTNPTTFIQDSSTALVINAARLDINNAADNEQMARFNQNGAVELYYDNVKKLQTSPSGFQMYGHLFSDDNNKIRLGNSQDLEIYHDGSNSIINDNGTGQLQLQVGGSTKFNTQSGGVQFYGSLYADDSNKIELGNDQDLKIYHDGSNSYIEDHGTGQLHITANGNNTAFSTLSTSGNSVYQRFEHTGHGSNYLGYEDDHFVVYTKDSGSNNHSVRINVDASGLAFHGDTAAANRLNDYEEGTFTPEYTMTGGGQNITYNVNQGNYTKIGDTVFIEIYISVSGINANGSGSLRISSLPFTKTGRYGGLNISYLTNSNGVEITHALVDVNSTNIWLYTFSGSSVSTTSVAGALTTSTEIMLNGTYITS